MKDFYFDDRSWMVRYLVADTGTWLTGRQVLLTPDAFGDQAFGKSPENPKSLRVKLSRRRVEESPSIDAHRPVSRQNEEAYYRHYGWPMYWSADPMSGAGATVPVAVAPLLEPARDEANPDPRNDAHLRSMLEVTGYGIRATDDEIGKAAGFLVDERTWRIEEMAVEAGRWVSGKEILIRANDIERIGYDESLVFVRLGKADIAATPRAEVARAS